LCVYEPLVWFDIAQAVLGPANRDLGARRLNGREEIRSMTVEHTNGSIVHVTSATFDGVVTSERPVLIDFWAPWCGPCRAIAPLLEEIAQELGDKVTIGKVNVDEHPDLAMRFGVQAIPQLLFFKDGAVKDKLVGAVPKRELVKRLDALGG
jgi:thioredoxin 1